MNRSATLMGLLAAVATSSDALAQPTPVAASRELSMETLVLTPTRGETSEADTLSALSIVREDELRRGQSPTAVDALREVPGLRVVESGSRGTTASVFLRGADTDQVLVLIDGVRVNSNTLGSFDFGNLTADNIERIEVIRGSGGTAAYGADAIGGVVQIFTRRGEGPPRASASVAGGNGSTHRETASLSGRTGIASYSVAFSHIDTEGFRRQNDDYENFTGSARLALDLLPGGVASAALRFGSNEAGNVFSNNFLGGADPNARSENDVLSVRGAWDHRATKALRYGFGVAYARDDLEFRDGPDSFETSSTLSEILSERITVDGRGEIDFSDQLRGIYGIEFERRSADVDSIFADPAFGAFPSNFDEEVDVLSGYLIHRFRVCESLLLTGSLRLDDDGDFGLELSPSGGAIWTIASTGTRLRAGYSEGFKAPSFNERFFPNFGNPDLDPETSWEVEGGVDQSLLEGQARLALTFFHRETEDLIAAEPDASGSFRAANVGRSEADGVEFALQLLLPAGLRFDGEYTWLDLAGGDGAKVRRPKHSGSLSLAGEWGEVLRAGDLISIDVRLLVVGERRDFDPSAFFATVDNSGYERADLAVAYDVALEGLLRSVGLFARVENLFDARYEESLGFDARPLNVLAGVRGEI